jgi:uncharacterized repeat protein (TIGR03803 family)
VAGSPVLAQTYKVIYNFTGGQDGADPVGLTIDNAGNVYGAANYGGLLGGKCESGCGTVLKLKQVNSAWLLTPLYAFQGGSDGLFPLAAVALDQNSSLYGTTTRGGLAGTGTVFNLKPPSIACRTALCSWNETLLYQFTDGSDGGFPDSVLVFDQNGNIFSTAPFGGGPQNAGVVYELSPSGGEWTESVLYAFAGRNDGFEPRGVIRDQAGSLYGVNYSGGANGDGLAYQLVPTGNGWTRNILHKFQFSDGGLPMGGLISDKSGNLYGTTTSYGPGRNGTVFMLSPSGGTWTLTVLHSFSGRANPSASLTVDAAGNLYGTSQSDGSLGCGTVFKLTPEGSGWSYSSLHDFTCGTGGVAPMSSVVFDISGNLLGVANGGTNGYGVVWEITP